MGELRLAVIGLGGISQNAHAPAIARNRAGVKMIAACDVRGEAVSDWTARYGCAGYTDFVEMVRKERPDAVLLATWPNQHREQIARLLDAGVRKILCEKALTLTGREAAETLRMVKQADAFVMEGFMYRHNPVIRKIEQVLSWGHLGPVDSVRACFSCFDAELEDPADPQRNWRQRKECGGGIPYDFACYCVNFCGHFAGGMPTRAYGIGNVGRYDTINRVYGTIEYDSGVVGIIESSKKSGFSQEVQVTCANGILNLPIAWTIDRDMTVTQRHGGWNSRRCDTYTTECVSDSVLSYRLQLENFAAAAAGQAAPVVPLAQSVVNTFALEALVTSVLEKRPVEIDIPAEVRDDCLAAGL